MATSFGKLVERTTTPEARAPVAVRTRQLLGEILAAEARDLGGASLSEVASVLGLDPAGLDIKAERDELTLTAVSRVVAALGGELEAVARFPGGMIALTPSREDQAEKSRSAALDFLAAQAQELGLYDHPEEAR